LTTVLRFSFEVDGRVVAAPEGPRVRLQAVRLAARDHARLAADAFRGVVEQADGVPASDPGTDAASIGRATVVAAPAKRLQGRSS
jgi:hypothetical protein